MRPNPTSRTGFALCVLLVCAARTHAQIPAVVISEIAAATDEDFTTPSYDAVELHNPTDAPADVSYWFISDSPSNYDKYRIPADTVIPPGGYHVFFQRVDTSVPEQTSYDVTSDAFALNADGEKAYLLSANAAGELTGYVRVADSPGTEDRVTVGRVVSSIGVENYVPMARNTLGGPNSGYDPGPAAISEILIDPGTSLNREFIELANLTDRTLALSHPLVPATEWRSNKFTLPATAHIPPRGTALVVGAGTDVAAFRAANDIPPGVPVYVAASLLDLDDASDSVRVERPARRFKLNSRGRGGPQIGEAQVDFVQYRTAVPWPTGTRGLGLSLERTDLFGIGNDPANWSASTQIGGTPGRLANPPLNAAFPDAALAAAVRDALGLAPDADIPIAMLRTLSSLDADSAGITDLSWIEYATGLETLSLRDNEIATVHALQSLPELISVDLRENRISRRFTTPLDDMIARGVGVDVRDQKDDDVIVTFPEAFSLERAVRAELGMSDTNLEITALDLLSIRELFVTASDWCSDLSGVEMMPNLERLLVHGYSSEDNGGPYVSDLTPLTGMTKLRYLNLTLNSISDLTPLAGLTELEHLTLQRNHVTDISPLAGLTKLEYLDLRQNLLAGGIFDRPVQTVDMSTFEIMSELRFLALGGLRGSETLRTDMSPLAGLTKLRSLDVSGTLMGDPTPLMSLTGLASLSLGSNYVEDLSFLAAFPNLRVFEMRSAFPAGLAPDEPLDFSPIADLTRLRNVSIEWFSSGVADLAPIAALPWVEHLRLPGIRLTDLSAFAPQLIAESHSLREFDVHWNWLDIRPGTANRELIDALEQSGTDVSIANQSPYSNPDFQSPSLTVSRTGPTLVTLSWIADPSLGFGTLESSTDLETWDSAGVSVDQPFGRSYWEAQIDLSSSGTVPMSHFRVRQ